MEARVDAVPAVAAEFVEGFRRFWRDPDPAELAGLLTGDVRLVQPLSPALNGIAEAQAELRRLFRWLPDMRGKVDRWRGDGEDVLIEFRLRARIGSRTVGWPVVDCFSLAGGRARERVSCFGPLPVLLQHARATRSLLRGWRSGAARPWVRRVSP